MSFERTPLLLWALSGIYHPDRHDAIIPVKGVEMIRHAEDRAGTELKRKSPENPVESGLSGFPDGAGGGGRPSADGAVVGSDSPRAVIHYRPFAPRPNAASSMKRTPLVHTNEVLWCRWRGSNPHVLADTGF